MVWLCHDSGVSVRLPWNNHPVFPTPYYNWETSHVRDAAGGDEELSPSITVDQVPEPWTSVSQQDTLETSGAAHGAGVRCLAQPS